MTVHAMEQVLHLGPERNLIAVWTPPVGRPMPLNVVFVNAGVIHRVGPHRLHVKLARCLARQGVGCARFDLSGVGDSLAPRDGVDFRSQAVRDVRAVMDDLATRSGITSFALVGMCSGAAHSQAAALVDRRVKGVFLIDGYVYPSWRSSWHFLLMMLRAYGPWQTTARLVRALKTRLRQRLRAEQTSSAISSDTRRSAKEFAQDMRALTQRQVQVCLMFTGSVLEVFAYPDHLRHQFAPAAWLDQVGCLFEPNVDHTLTLQGFQRHLANRLVPWLKELSCKIARQV
jgi:pimeloyl-ACP methyl ester carboxylesterase